MMGGLTEFRKTLAKGEDDLADKRHAEMMLAFAKQSAAMTAQADTLAAAMTARTDTLAAAMTAQGETLSLIATLLKAQLDRHV
jgi:hypothetical protein